MHKYLLLLTLLYTTATMVEGQTDFFHGHTFSRADTLRGSLRPERNCYDVTFYELDIEVDERKQAIAGSVAIHFRVVEDFTRLQIDLFDNMVIDRILHQGAPLPYVREHNAVFVQFPAPQVAGTTGSIEVVYHGQPLAAQNAPWDGGFVWAKDSRGRPWTAVACEGTGASLWWPNKDHLSDEPDSMRISLTVDKAQMAIANGNLRSVEQRGDKTQYNWFVGYPIDNYNVTVNIGRYAAFDDRYFSPADGDTLELDYYVMDYNLDVARKHFKQVQPMLACYEQYLGKYPFWNDGFAMVETPYLGMEHQGAIAYGNRFMRGYLGGMIPRDMDWDYIIIHEAGHEYYGNSIGCADMAEMWIQESFTTYLESVYVECTMGYPDAVRYLAGQRAFIANKEPIIGPIGVNFDHWAHSDHYFKGAWMLHTLRHAIADDTLWWDIFKGFYQQHQQTRITTADFVTYVNSRTGRSWDAFFRQYLSFPSIPTLEYKLTPKGKNLQVAYRWKADVPGFDMPIQVGKKGKLMTLSPTTEWQETTVFQATPDEFMVAKDLFLVDARAVR